MYTYIYMPDSQHCDSALDHGFHIGPMNITFEQLKEHVKSTALNCHMGGGGWGIIHGGVEGEHSTVHGPRQRFICDRKGTTVKQGCKCLWNIYYEASTQG